MTKSLILFLLIIDYSLAAGVSEAFTKEGIVPDVLKTAPNGSIQISYGNKNVSQGNVLKLTEVAQAPAVSWSGDEKELYALIKGKILGQKFSFGGCESLKITSFFTKVLIHCL
jgi:hypothetical protein